MGVNRDVTRRHIESEYRGCAATPIHGIVRQWPLGRSVTKWVGDDARLHSGSIWKRECWSHDRGVRNQMVSTAKRL